MPPAAKPNPIRDSYPPITPSLTVQGGVKALEFYGADEARFPRHERFGKFLWCPP
jgi:hypothetical protein